MSTDAALRLRADVLFLSTSAITDGYQQSQTVLAKQVLILLADHTKFHKRALRRLPRLAPLTEFDVVIVDPDAARADLEAIIELGVHVEIAGKATDRRDRRTVIDLNSDLGEGFGIWPLTHDDALLSIVTSANVACGFHAGDPTVLRRVTEQAAGRGVSVGAQVAYRDLAGFGRRFIDVDPAELVNDVIYQIAALDGFARVAGTRVRYVKPHGALYNAIVTHAEQAAAVVEAVKSYDASLPVLGLPGSEWLRQAEAAGLTVVREAFADRAYTPEGTLVSRRLPGAVIADAEAVTRRVVQMATEGTITAIDGSTVKVDAQSICVHGDTPGAVEIAQGVRDALVRAGVTLRAFASAAAGA
jgi:UPF0271 protein